MKGNFLKNTAVSLSIIAISVTGSAFGDCDWEPDALENVPESVPEYILEPVCCPKQLHTKVEVGVSYYYFSSGVLTQIYDNGAVNYRASISQAVTNYLDVWAGASYLRKEGKTEELHQRTSIQIIPVSLGLKYILPFNFSHVDIYLNGAFKYFFFNTRDHSDFVEKHRSESGLGGVFGTGSYIHFGKHFFLDLFVDYSFKKMHFSDKEPHIKGHSLQIGGWDFGGGLGYQF